VPPSPPRTTLHGLLEQAAARDPAHEALRYRSRRRTYGELDGDANALARALIQAGVRRGDRVALFLPKGVEAVTAVYAAMKAGAAYVPIDPNGPAARGALVAADCRVAALVTTPELGPGLLAAMGDHGHAPHTVVVVGDPTAGTWPSGPTVLAFDGAVADGDRTSPGLNVTEADLAYILYTSGSTGVPKGVMLSHRNGLAFVEWSAARIGVDERDVLSNHAPLHFDLSVFDLYVAALAGATLVVVSSEEAYLAQGLVNLIRREGITTWYSVPSALMVLMRALDGPGDLPSLRTVVFAGEVYPTPQLRELRRLLPDVGLWNIYGPTETNVVTYYPVLEVPSDDRTIPIGRACENSDVFAIDEAGAVAGEGEVGELYARGPTVMKGYWGRPERTAEVLVPDPRFPHLPDLAYRTGDLVRLRPDGDYDFLGRRDHQIKSRGYRIELGEIEATLNANPDLVEAAVVALPHPEWGSAVIAFVIPRPGLDVTPNGVKRFVAARLPRYMVPASVQVLAEFPRTSTGKVDRRGLQELLPG
jgi:amino acid adenylation domain-containing protein